MWLAVPVKIVTAWAVVFTSIPKSKAGFPSEPIMLLQIATSFQNMLLGCSYPPLETTVFNCYFSWSYTIICFPVAPSCSQLLTSSTAGKWPEASSFLYITCKTDMEPYWDKRTAVLSGTSAEENHSSKETHLYHSPAADDMFKDVDQGWRDSKATFHPIQKVLTGSWIKFWISLSHFTFWNAMSASAFSPSAFRGCQHFSVENKQAPVVFGLGITLEFI